MLHNRIIVNLSNINRKKLEYKTNLTVISYNEFGKYKEIINEFQDIILIEFLEEDSVFMETLMFFHTARFSIPMHQITSDLALR